MGVAITQHTNPSAHTPPALVLNLTPFCATLFSRLSTRCCVTAPSSTTAAAASAAPAPAMPNPAQIALAAARNLGMPTALPGQQAPGALSGLGGGAGFQANPQLLAQVMRTAQQQAGNPGQCKRGFCVVVGGRRVLCVWCIFVCVLCVRQTRGCWEGFRGVDEPQPLACGSVLVCLALVWLGGFVTSLNVVVAFHCFRGTMGRSSPRILCGTTTWLCVVSLPSKFGLHAVPCLCTTIFSAASCVKLYSRPLRSPPAPRASPAVWHMSVT